MNSLNPYHMTQCVYSVAHIIWYTVTCLPGSEVIKVKHSPNSKTLSFRVRIVTSGHRQVKGINYTEKFSAAAKMPTVQVILANTAHQDWEIEHIDAKSVYLNAKLKETIYMKLPRGVLKCYYFYYSTLYFILFISLSHNALMPSLFTIMYFTI